MTTRRPVALLVGVFLIGALGGLVGQQGTRVLTAQPAPLCIALKDFRGQYLTTWDSYRVQGVDQHPVVANRPVASTGETFCVELKSGSFVPAPATPTPTPIPVPPAGAYWLDRDYILGQLFATVYGPYHAVPGPRGTGALDIDYYIDNIVATGGWTEHTDRGENNVGYWTSRIGSDLERAGYRK